MEIKDFRKILKKEGFNVKTKTHNIGIHATIVFPNGHEATGNVFWKEQSDYLKKINRIVAENKITKLTKDGEKVACQFIK